MIDTAQVIHSAVLLLVFKSDEFKADVHHRILNKRPLLVLLNNKNC